MLPNYVLAAILASYPPYQFRKSQYATRMYRKGGIGSAANTSKWVNASAIVGGYVTSHVCMDAEAPFLEVALIFGNEDATAYTISGASVAPGATLNDLTNSTATGRSNFVAVTFGGLASGTLPAGSTTNPGYLVSDSIPCVSVARAAGDATTWSVAGGKLADSYTRPLLHIRVAQPTAAINSTLPGMSVGKGTGADAPFNPSAPTKSGRFISCKNAAAATVQTSVGGTAALTGTMYGPFTGIINMPIVGVIFKYAGNAMSIVTCGDSISEGAGLVGTAGDGRPWGLMAPQYVSTMTNPIEYSLLALAGQHTATYAGYFATAIAAGITWTHATFAAFSPNNGSDTPGMTTDTNTFLAACTAHNICPLIWTGLAVGLIAPQKLSVAGESNRLAYNAGIRAGTTFPGVAFMEMEQAVGASGQVMTDYGTGDSTNHIASITASPVVWGDPTYNLHPNYVGDQVMRTVYQTQLTSMAAAYFA